MRQFIRGWRRKVGVLTLVMALVFTVAWVRSYLIWDHLSLPNAKGAISSLEFSKGFCVWLFSDSIGVRNNNGLGFIKDSIDISGSRVMLKSLTGRAGIVVVPHFAVVLPLAFISFWLLLIAPRKLNQERISEPIQWRRWRLWTRRETEVQP